MYQLTRLGIFKSRTRLNRPSAPLTHRSTTRTIALAASARMASPWSLKARNTACVEDISQSSDQTTHTGKSKDSIASSQNSSTAAQLRRFRASIRPTPPFNCLPSVVDPPPLVGKWEVGRPSAGPRPKVSETIQKPSTSNHQAQGVGVRCRY